MGETQDPQPGGFRQRRRWRFASVIFDESRWSLIVDGQPAAIEAKPLEVLRELLLRPGEVVTREELLHAVWPGVLVVEASLSTAVMKLRRALGEEGGAGGIVETVPRIGYRISIPVALELLPAPANTGAGSAVSSGPAGIARAPAFARRWIVAGALGFAFVAGLLIKDRLFASLRSPLPPAYTLRDAREALRELDLEKIKAMLRAGWNPNAPFDAEGNGALNILMNDCEWNPAHDPERLVIVARTLIEGGALPEKRNIWGDTTYSIARAERYCGLHHPIAAMLQAYCFNGPNPPGDKCLYRAPRIIPRASEGAKPHSLDDPLVSF